jgi:hypothetical protein
MSKLEPEYITVEFNLEVSVYEDLLAHARVVHYEPDLFVQALIDLYSKQFVQEMIGVR